MFDTLKMLVVIIINGTFDRWSSEISRRGYRKHGVRVAHRACPTILPL